MTTAYIDPIYLICTGFYPQSYQHIFNWNDEFIKYGLVLVKAHSRWENKTEALKGKTKPELEPWDWEAVVFGSFFELDSLSDHSRR